MAERIGITGHVRVTREVAGWVSTALTERLGPTSRIALHGITCLAPGADQIFAAVVLSLSGTLDVVLPSRDYACRVERTSDGAFFASLLAQARSVETLPFERSSREAFLAASEIMLSRCDLLLAVWDGRPSRRVGDTAHVVARAQQVPLPVEVFWPPGSIADLPPAPATPIPAEAPGRG